jgi:hypothetical protein
MCRKCQEHIHRGTPYNWVTQLNFEGKQETWKQEFCHNSSLWAPWNHDSWGLEKKNPKASAV